MQPSDFSKKGYSLVELMISLVILGILVAGIYTVYINMHSVWVSQDLKAQTQQTGRVALDYVQRDMMMMGYRSKSYGAGGTKYTEDKILFATQSTIVFDRWVEAPVNGNRIIKYYVKADANGKRSLYRDAYTDFDDASWRPQSPDSSSYNFGQPIIEDVSLLRFNYSSMTGPLDYSALGESKANQANRNKIVKIEVIIQSKSTKKDPVTKNYVVLTNSITVTPVNLRTTETVADTVAPLSVSGLNVVDTCQCTGAITGSLKVKWTRSGEGDLAGYVLYWGRLSGTYESSVTIPTENLADVSNPTWTITSAEVSKTGTPNIYYVSVRAYDNSLNYGPLSTAIYNNSHDTYESSLTSFGGDDDTAVNVPKPDSPPAGFDAQNRADDINIGQNQVKLTWTKDTEAVKGYRIYRKVGTGDFPDYPIDDAYEIARETTLDGNAISYTDNDPSLVTCTDYRYAICSVNCDETLVATYTSSDYTTLVKAPTNTQTPTPPDISANTKGGYKRIFIGLTNPVRTGWDADFYYTMVYWRKLPAGSYPEIDSDGNLIPGTGYTVPNTDCGVPGKFIHEGTITTIFNDETEVLPNTVDPNLNNETTYRLLAVAHYKCRGHQTDETISMTLAELCDDDPDFPGPPPMNGGLDPNTDAAYTGLSVVKSGGCIYSNISSSVETRKSIRFDFSYGGQGDNPDAKVYDYAGVYVIKKAYVDEFTSGATITTTGPLWSSYSEAYSASQDGSKWDYWFKLADCSYVNAGNPGGLTPDTDAMKIKGVSPGDIKRKDGDKNIVFGSFSTVQNQQFYHNAVKFNIVNTANCNISIQSLDNITWNNTDAYLKRVIIGPSSQNTIGYEQNIPIPGGSVLSGSTRTATVAFTSNPVIQDLGDVTLGPSVSIPVILEFANSAGSVDQFVDLRGVTITMNIKYTNTSTSENGCARNGTISITLGPAISGVVQDKPTSPTLPYEVPGSSGENTPPAIVIEGGQKLNVSANIADADAALSTVKLYYKTTEQVVSSIDNTGFTPVDMLNPASSLYSLTNGSTDRRIPSQEGYRIWYYIMARDAGGNFDRSPAPYKGYYTYDQKIFSICDKTPKAPALTATKTTVGLNEYGSLSWTAPAQYTDGSDIETTGSRADVIRYDIYRKDGFDNSYDCRATNLTALTYDDPTALIAPTIYYIVAKNNCDTGPNVSARSNEGIICAGSTGGCSVLVDPTTASISTNWSTHSGDTSAQVNVTVFICDRAQDGSVWNPDDGYDTLSDIDVNISSVYGEGLEVLPLYEVNGDSGIFRPIPNAFSVPLPTDSNVAPVTIAAVPPAGNFGHGATTAANLTDTVTFTTASGTINCSSVSASVAVSTDPCSNTPGKVDNTVTAVISGNSVKISWPAVTKNTDNSTINDVSKYKIYINNIFAYEAAAPATSKTVLKSDFSQGAIYTVSVSAVDSCSNEGEKSDSINFTR